MTRNDYRDLFSEYTRISPSYEIPILYSLDVVESVLDDTEKPESPSPSSLQVEEEAIPDSPT